MYNTCRSIVSLLVAVSISVMAIAQTTEPDSVSVKVPIWQGITIETDVVPLVTNFLNDAKTFRYEAAGRINLLNQYYPVVEVGYEGQQKIMKSGTNFMASGLFYRLGLDFNLVKKKEDKAADNKFLVGARLGFSNFNYDMLNMKVRDEYLQQDFQQDFTNLTSNSLWFEVVAGIRIEVFKRVTLGWTARLKNQFGEPEPGTFQPYSIPGYGISGGNVWAFNYMIGYQF